MTCVILTLKLKTVQFIHLHGNSVVVGAGEVAQWAKCWLHKPKDLGLNT